MYSLYDVVDLVKSLRKDGRAVTALEYGLIAGAIALAITGAVGTLGTSIKNIFTSLSAASW
jgi:Flp pilus assembly pilin Flp